MIGIGNHLALRRYAVVAKIAALRETKERTGVNLEGSLADLWLVESLCNYSCVKWEAAFSVNSIPLMASIRTGRTLSRDFSLYDARQNLCQSLTQLLVVFLEPNHG